MIDLLKKGTEKVLGFFSSVKVRIIAISVAIAISLSITAVAVYTGQHSDAVEVKFDGKLYGYVADMTEAEKVISTVSEGVLGGIEAERFSCENVTVLSDKLTVADTIATTVKSECKDIITVCGVYIDGNMVAMAESEESAKAVFDGAVATLTVDGAEFKGFNKQPQYSAVVTNPTYFEGQKLVAEKVLSGEYGVEITTVKTETYEEEIKYQSVTQKDSSKKTSYKKVTQSGKNGLRSVTAEITFVNGQKQSSKEIDSKVLKQAQKKITVVGTKRDTVYYSGYKLATSIMDKSSAKYVFPVNCSGSTYITSFWGDGRGHKGLDIAAPKGTPVYAAASGTVTFAGSSGSYGKLIKIKHADGNETVYAHNSSILVKKGQAVSAGQTIAKVGATGNATGNHLHFEVKVNGKQVDAAPYVGLK